MTEQIPALLKPIGRYLQAAKQVEKAAPVIAYHCRFYAVQLGLQLRGKNADPDVKKYIMNLMDTLESQKTALEAELNRVDRKEQFVLNFALSAFKHADDEDRAGNATKKTARDFLHAAIFFDVVTQFGDLSTEYKDLQKYAKWKAVQITSAIKRGEKPLPGPVGWDPSTDAMEIDEDGGNSEANSAPNTKPGVPLVSHGAPIVPTAPNATSLSGIGLPAALPNVVNPSPSLFAAPSLFLSPVANSSPAVVSKMTIDAPAAPAKSSKDDEERQAIARKFDTEMAAKQRQIDEQMVLIKQQQQQMALFQQQQQQRAQASPSAIASVAIGGVRVGPDEFAKALQQARYVLSALQFEDAATAAKHCRLCLKILTGSES